MATRVERLVRAALSGSSIESYNSLTNSLIELDYSRAPVNCVALRVGDLSLGIAMSARSAYYNNKCTYVRKLHWIMRLLLIAVSRTWHYSNSYYRAVETTLDVTRQKKNRGKKEIYSLFEALKTCIASLIRCMIFRSSEAQLARI